ncbi:MAG: 5'-3' exonuclease H3TH domain-containing protein, partial [Dehalococcoidia bacterium]
YLIDGTYELFRHFFAIPSRKTAAGREVAATVGVLTSVAMMLESGVTHVGVATDKVIESFRNALWPGYKTGAGIDPQLLQQFPLLEEGLEAMGVCLWAMVEVEADDALGSAAKLAAAYPEVDRVLICTPDKDMGQCVTDDGRVVQLDRRKNLVTDKAGVIAKFGVPPASIPDYLALVGDSADGYPGLPGWGAKGAGAVLTRYGTIEAIPDDASAWDITIRGADKMAATLRENRDLAMLFKHLATLRDEEPLFDSLDALRWQGPTGAFAAFCAAIESDTLLSRVTLLASKL